MVVLILGVSSLPGDYLIEALRDSGHSVIACSRQPQPHLENLEDVQTILLDGRQSTIHADVCICLAPIWVIADYYLYLISAGIKKVVALSSTSVLSKKNAQSASDRHLASKLYGAEQDLLAWGQKNQLDCVVLRPTLIYADGKDHNIASIARFIKRFGFFPVLGKAQGKRQPIHAKDVAKASLYAALEPLQNTAYSVCGGEILSYYQMVCRVFVALNKKPRIVRVPLWMVSSGAFVLKLLPRFRHVSAGMAVRMNQDLVFSDPEFQPLPGFKAAGFHLTKRDVCE